MRGALIGKVVGRRGRWIVGGMIVTISAPIIEGVLHGCQVVWQGCEKGGI